MFNGNVYFEGDASRGAAALAQAEQFAATVRQMKSAIGVNDLIRSVDLPGGVRVTVADISLAPSMTIFAPPAAAADAAAEAEKAERWHYLYATVRREEGVVELARTKVLEDSLVQISGWEFIAKETALLPSIPPFSRYAVGGDDKPVWVEEIYSGGGDAETTTYTVWVATEPNTAPDQPWQKKQLATQTYSRVGRVFTGRRILNVAVGPEGFYLLEQENYPYDYEERRHWFELAGTNAGYGYARTDPYIANIFGIFYQYSQDPPEEGSYVPSSELPAGHAPFYTVLETATVIGYEPHIIGLTGSRLHVRFISFADGELWDTQLPNESVSVFDFRDLSAPQRFTWVDYSGELLYVGVPSTTTQQHIDVGQRTYILETADGAFGKYYQPAESWITVEGSASDEIVATQYRYLETVIMNRNLDEVSTTEHDVSVGGVYVTDVCAVRGKFLLTYNDSSDGPCRAHIYSQDKDGYVESGEPIKLPGGWSNPGMRVSRPLTVYEEPA